MFLLYQIYIKACLTYNPKQAMQFPCGICIYFHLQTVTLKMLLCNKVFYNVCMNAHIYLRYLKTVVSWQFPCDKTSTLLELQLIAESLVLYQRLFLEACFLSV